MKVRVFAMHARTWDFPSDRNPKEMVHGGKAQVCFSKSEKKIENQVGNSVAFLRMPREVLDQITVAPAVYEADIDFTAKNGEEFGLLCTELKLVCSVPLNDLIEVSSADKEIKLVDVAKQAASPTAAKAA
jgi:hypothetical protein